MSNSFSLISTRSIPVALGALLVFGCGSPDVGKPDQGAETQQKVGDAIAPLTFLPPEVRADQLRRLANEGSKAEKHQAKYLYAADLVEQNQGEVALDYLKNLEKKYPVLGGEILVLRAKAYTDQPEQAEKVWRDILEQYSQESAAAEALYALGKRDPQYWDQALEQFPSHPRAVDIAVERLKIDPQRVDLLMLIAKHGHWHPDYGRYLARLTKDFEGQLQPPDWQAIAFGHWDRQVYKQAGLAYAKAPQTSQTAFRAARGLQLGGEKEDAIARYKQMIAKYPDAEETATALLRLAELDPTAGISTLDRAFKLAKANQETHRGGQILLAKVRQLKKQNAATAPIEKQLLEAYGKTAAAAEFRWEMAQESADAQDLAAARDWTRQIQKQNLDSEQAAQATFWSGKWGEQLGNALAMKEAANQLWKHHPESYYAWRMASQLKWEVGDFNTVRFLQPEISLSQSRLPLPAGSPTVKILYQLGQSQTAYDRWLWEYKNRAQRSFEEQLTDGLLRIEEGDYLRGMLMLLNLYYRAQEEPDQRSLYQEWRQDPRFWQALYPLAYFQPVSKWSKQRNLNSLLVLGLIRQESRFQPEIRSVAGAVGLMQVLPSTGEQTSQQIGLQDYWLTDVEDNINLGTAYFDYVHQLYQNNSVLAIASYNAGPGNVAKWLRELPTEDTDVFIEAIPFPETNNYVRVVLENHWNYLRLYNSKIAKQLKQKS